MADQPEREAAQRPELAEQARAAWLQFRAAFEPLRPELYRYCRHLTASPWDAEDLVQEALMRALVTLGSQYGHEIREPRAWLFRVASNAWIDRVRRAREELGTAEAQLDADGGQAPVDPRPARAAASALISRLSPQERVAFVLKDAFDLSLEEIAAVLATSVGAVKAALHRGRGKLEAESPAPSRVPVPAAIDAFCAAFNAGDLQALTKTLLEAATIELPGVSVDLGVTESCHPERGILYHCLLTPLSSGVPPRFLAGYLPTPPRAELRAHRGEPILLLWYAHTSGDAVRSFYRFTLDPDSGQIAKLSEYYYSPEALAEVAGELGVPVRANGYGM